MYKFSYGLFDVLTILLKFLFELYSLYFYDEVGWVIHALHHCVKLNQYDVILLNHFLLIFIMFRFNLRRNHRQLLLRSYWIL